MLPKVSFSFSLPFLSLICTRTYTHIHSLTYLLILSLSLLLKGRWRFDAEKLPGNTAATKERQFSLFLVVRNELIENYPFGMCILINTFKLILLYKNILSSLFFSDVIIWLSNNTSCKKIIFFIRNVYICNFLFFCHVYRYLTKTWFY